MAVAVATAPLTVAGQREMERSVDQVLIDIMPSEIKCSLVSSRAEIPAALEGTVDC